MTKITRNGKVGVLFMPTMKTRTALTQKLKRIFRRFQSQSIGRVIGVINPILRGWVNYFRVGMSSQTFGYIKDWVEKKIRRHLMIGMQTFALRCKRKRYQVIGRPPAKRCSVGVLRILRLYGARLRYTFGD